MGGIADSLLLVSFCGLCTFLTAISLSAIATNGAMKVFCFPRAKLLLETHFFWLSSSSFGRLVKSEPTV